MRFILNDQYSVYKFVQKLQNQAWVVWRMRRNIWFVKSSSSFVRHHDTLLLFRTMCARTASSLAPKREWERKERKKGRGLKGKKKEERKERNKEENARTKVRNRERFLTFRTRIRVARLLLFIVAFHEKTGESLSPSRSSSAAPLPLFWYRRFLAAVLAL